MKITERRLRQIIREVLTAEGGVIPFPRAKKVEPYSVIVVRHDRSGRHLDVYTDIKIHPSQLLVGDVSDEGRRRTIDWDDTREMFRFAPNTDLGDVSIDELDRYDYVQADDPRLSAAYDKLVVAAFLTLADHFKSIGVLYSDDLVDPELEDTPVANEVEDHQEAVAGMTTEGAAESTAAIASAWKSALAQAPDNRRQAAKKEKVVPLDLFR